VCHIGNAVSTDLFGCSSEPLKNASVFEREDYEAVQDNDSYPSFILKITGHTVESEQHTHTLKGSNTNISFYNSYCTQTRPNGLSHH